MKLRKLHFSRSISSIFAWSSKLMVDGDSMGPPSFFLGNLSGEFKLCRMSIFHEIQMAMSVWGYRQMVGHAGSPTSIVHVDVTFTRSKVKVNVTGLLNFQKLWLWLQVYHKKPCVLAAMTVRSLAGLFMAALCNGQVIYIFILSFVLSLLFFFPRLISAVYHTSTHGVALVRI